MQCLVNFQRTEKTQSWIGRINYCTSCSYTTTSVFSTWRQRSLQLVNSFPVSFFTQPALSKKTGSLHWVRSSFATYIDKVEERYTFNTLLEKVRGINYTNLFIQPLHFYKYSIQILQSWCLNKPECLSHQQYYCQFFTFSIQTTERRSQYSFCDVPIYTCKIALAYTESLTIMCLVHKLRVFNYMLQ